MNTKTEKPKSLGPKTEKPTEKIAKTAKPKIPMPPPQTKDKPPAHFEICVCLFLALGKVTTKVENILKTFLQLLIYNLTVFT